MDTVKLIAGRSNKPLAHGIVKALGKSLVNCTIDSFANGEIRVEINENVRGCHVFIIQTGGTDNENSINDYLVETLLIVDACKRADAHKVAVVLACFPYARSDKRDKRGVPIGASMAMNLLKAAGANRIISMDLHSGQLQGFTKLPCDNLYGIKLHIDNLLNGLFKGLTFEEINSKYVLVSLDVGGAKRCKEYARRLHMCCGIMDKQRDNSKPNTVLKSALIGDVKDKIAICIDDMVDTCGTVLSGIADLQEHGARSAIILATHGVLSGPAAKRINECDFIKQVIVVDTLDQTKNMQIIPKLQVIESYPLFAEVIKRIICGGSVSALFE